MAEAELHDLVKAARTRGHVVVHDQRHQAVALDSDHLVALLLDELPEEIVSQVEQGLRAVSGLTQSQEPRPGGEQPHDASGIDDADGVPDGSSHTLNAIVELSIETWR